MLEAEHCPEVKETAAEVTDKNVAPHAHVSCCVHYSG